MSIVMIRNIGNVNDDSAQLTIDYIAGLSIFLLAVAFVFQFMYGLFIPFQSNSDDVTLAADRASMALVERLLVADRSMNVIDQGKLYYFNNTKLNSTNETAYYNTLRELGLYSNEIYYDMNISVINISSPSTPMNQGGPPLPENLDIGQTKRLVLIVNSSTGMNQTAIISVRVW